MTTLKDFRFQVDVEGGADRVVTLTAKGKPDLTVATPPEFRGGIPDVWSPEDMLVAAVASCYALTVTAVAERRVVPFRDLTVRGAGHMTRRADGRFGFVVIELGVAFTTDEGHEDEARKAAQAAQAACLVANALAIPVEVELRLKTEPIGARAVVLL